MGKKVDNLETLNRIKTIMMIFIVLYHSMALWLPEGWFNQIPKQKSIIISIIAQYLNLIHIYVFTFVSGIVFGILKFEKKRYNSYKVIICKKVNRLLVPYVSVMICWCIPFYCIFFKPTLKDIFLNYILGYAPSQLWYLLMLFWIFICVYPIADYINNMSYKNICVLAVCIYLAYYIFSMLFELPFQLLTTFKYLPFFILGMKYDSFNHNRVGWYSVINIALFAVYLLIPDGNCIIRVIKKVVTFGVSYYGVLTIMKLPSNFWNLKLWENHIVKYFEKNSFLVYLFHQQVIWIMVYFLNGLVSPALIVVVSFIVSIFISFGIINIMNRYRVTRFLIGGK